MTTCGSFLQTNVDLFASQPAPAVSTTVDFFAAPDPVPKASESDTTSNIVDPFAAVPMNNFDTDRSSTVSDQSSPSHGKTNVSSSETKSPPKKGAFQVTSGIWADSLSRGLIDLNITARKYFSLVNNLLLIDEQIILIICFYPTKAYFGW